MASRSESSQVVGSMIKSRLCRLSGCLYPVVTTLRLTEFAVEFPSLKKWAAKESISIIWSELTEALTCFVRVSPALSIFAVRDAVAESTSDLTL